MGVPTSPVDRVLHLALFIAAAVSVAVVALALLERLLDGERRVVRLWHVAIPIAAFAAIGIAERLYHAFFE